MQTISPVTGTPLNGIDASRNQELAQTTSTNELSKPQQEDTSGRKTLTSEEKKKLTRLVTACYEGLNIYGKSPAQLESVIMLMQIALKYAAYDKIRAAFERHLKESSTMPTPNDILKYIENDEHLSDYERQTQILGAAAWKRDKKMSLNPEQKRFLDNYEKKNGSVWWHNLEQFKSGKN